MTHTLSTAEAYDLLAAWYRQTVSADYGVAALRRALQLLGRTGAALDVGCGSEGRFIDILLKEGFQVEGLDSSAGMLALAAQRHPQVPFHQGDICTWSLPRQYDFICAWDSTFHLPLDQQEPVLRKLCAGLRQGGVLLFTCGGTDGAEEITGTMEGIHFSYSSLGVNAYLALLNQYGCLVRHVEHDQHPEKHVHIIAQRRG